MLHLFRRSAVALTCLIAAIGSVHASETSNRLTDVEQRLDRLEQSASNNQGLLLLSARIDTLEQQLRELRGQVEELQNSNEQLRKQQRDLYADLDRRITALQGTAAASPGSYAGPGAAGSTAGAGVGGVGTSGPGSAGTGAGPGDAGGDQAAYSRAFDALKGKDYDSAIGRFKDFLRQYPQSTLAGNAQYWLGEAYYVTRDLDDAAASFRAVGEQYPKSSKVPDALVALGMTQIDQQHLSDGRLTLSQVVQRYPGTDAAKLATSRLGNLPPDGR